ncbi:MAG: DNA repair protein RadC [Puniceicoccales bacterium]|jgi:DNA repair protein RadC|nr:DNA repair protein RadC [Puniceicoccales bacterium]
MMPGKEHEGHRKRLRERFLKGGFCGFADHEIVELILTLCIQRRDVKKQAKMLLRKFGSIGGVFDADLSELKSVEGIGEVAAVAIKIVRASTDLYLRERVEKNQRLDESGELIKFWKNRMRGLCFEIFEVAYLDADLCLLKDGIEEIGRGSASCVHVDLRKILEIALSRHASCIIFAHNHPCGDARPSDIDECITRKAKAAAELLGITLVDHIIISKVDEFSFRDHGLVI